MTRKGDAEPKGVRYVIDTDGDDELYAACIEACRQVQRERNKAAWIAAHPGEYAQRVALREKQFAELEAKRDRENST